LPHTVERVFLGWDQPALPAAATHIVEHYADGAVADLRKVTLVLPGGRARRRIIELLLDSAEARGVTLIPPHATTVGMLPELCHSHGKAVADQASSHRAWSRALRGIDRQALEAVFPHLPESDDMSAWDEIALLLSALHQELAGGGHRFGDVARICGSGLVFDDGARWTVLEQVQRRYLYVLDQAGLADLFELRMGALESGSATFRGDLWLISIADIPVVTQKLLQASGATVRTLIHAPDDSEIRPNAVPAFDVLGLPVTEYWESAPVPIADHMLDVVERPVDQSDAVIAALEHLGGEYSAEEVVVAVHEASEVVPYLEQRLEARGVVPRYAAGTPMTRTAPARLLQAVADYLDEGSFQAFAALLRHPDVAPLVKGVRMGAEGPETLEVADLYFSEHLPSTARGELPRGNGWAASFPVLARVAERDSPLGGLGGRRPLSEWMPPIVNLLLTCYGDMDWDRSRPAHRRLLDAITRIHSAAAALSTLPAALNEKCMCGAGIRALLRELADSALPPDARRDAVELLNWLELPLDDAPCVLLTAFNEGFLPESLTGHPFLPDSLRTLLGLTDNRRRLARDTYRLVTVLNSKESLRLIAGRRSASGDPLLPSRLMFRIPEEEMPRRVLEFLNRKGTRRPGAPLGSLGLEPGARSEFRVPPEPAIQLAFEEVPLKLAVTGFKAFLADPYRFALERLRNLSNLHDDARELDPLRFGSLAHEVLQRFGDAALAMPPTVDVTDASSVEATLLASLADAVSARFGHATLPAVHIQVEQLAARLRAFAVKQSEWAQAGWRIMAVECEPEGDGMPFEVDGTPFLLRGKIDRIDHNASTGRWAVLDYKTGNSVSPPERAHRRKRAGELEWIDLQLPLYRRLLSGIVDGAGKRIVDDRAIARGAVVMGYISLPRKTQDTAFLLAEWTAEELETAEEVARNVIGALREGRFEFDPNVTKISRWGDDPLEPLISVGWQSTVEDDGFDHGPGGGDDSHGAAAGRDSGTSDGHR
jgi:ATP-dependent helicase/nuclease subunit B